MNKIIVVGAGYVGMSNAILLSQKNEVIIVDIDSEKVERINKDVRQLIHRELWDVLNCDNLNIKGTTDLKEVISDADYVIVATPTNYDPELGGFDTLTVESVLQIACDYAPNAVIIIKSTIPIGYTDRISHSLNNKNIIFSPEFLREEKALYDNLYPSRIVIGSKTEFAHRYAKLLCDGALKKDIPVLYVHSTEAEAIKLFANSYLALRVAFFNELDTYAEMKSLDSKSIIDGICSDPRIGNFYNNPSFGYGGYCLPKDTKQLLSDFKNIPNSIFQAIVDSNKIRKKYIAKKILEMNPKIVGIYRITMKTESNNFRQAAVIDIMDILISYDVKVYIYEPLIDGKEFAGLRVIENLNEFKYNCDLIIANRWDPQLDDIKDKVYTRDMYGRD